MFSTNFVKNCSVDHLPAPEQHIESLSDFNQLQSYSNLKLTNGHPFLVYADLREDSAT